ncbi:MAG: response regulator [Candidatus Cloacimonetes bacterium]|nr:response regulator [Candidatus Cloacimonadota bacterium]MCF7815308.1 response regulator [Candidatus Cloacimonadota bacterium]MCF7869422.1 response regulator [Candidatus Cloacimonadota bacterium]MCF7884819.1 response regulator [Candidatus Cloacimonadota bacterium]
MKKILIVEDEQIIAQDIKMLLDMEGYEVISVHDRGEEALKQIKQERPDLVLVDIDLPGRMNGIELSKEIGLKMGIPVIFVTAFSEAKTVKKAMETKPAAYIMKPIFDEDLLIEIRKALK